MHSRDHRNSRLNFSRQLHLVKQHSDDSADLFDMARQPDSGRADHMRSEQPTKIASRNLVLNAGSAATWSLRPKFTLRAGHFMLLAKVICCRLHNGSKFGSRLATRADVKRLTIVAEGVEQMLRASESAAVSGFHAGRGPVGGWTLDLEPHVKRNVAPAGSRAESLELSVMVPQVREPLILMWTLQ